MREMRRGACGTHLGLKAVQVLAQQSDTDEGLSAQLAFIECAEETRGDCSQRQSHARRAGDAG